MIYTKESLQNKLVINASGIKSKDEYNVENLSLHEANLN